MVNASSSSYSDSTAFVNAIDSWIDTISFYTPGSDVDPDGLRGNAMAALVLFSVKGYALLFSDKNSGCGIGAGYQGTFVNITISNHSEVTADSGKYAAAIGSGDENANGGGTITITDSTVIATAGSDAAGIGTGNECGSACDAINITNSTVTAHGGRYGAGIGGGDDVSGGTINITNSTIKEADSKTDGAGIGGGESGSGGTITIKNSSVTAHGGGYAAGIGGGEDGNGGKIYIINGSNVYAKGKEYGAGIGGGEDSNGEYCKIESDCTVEAVSGGDCNVQSIGHGDCGWYVSEYTGGTLSLGSKLKVKANGNIYTGDARFNAVWNNKSVKIYSCEHNHLEKRAEDASNHADFCKDCGARVGAHEKHQWNSNNICEICGVSKEKCMLQFVERNNSGEVRYDIETLSLSGTKLPECQNVPDGYCFSCWVSSEGIYYLPGESYKEPFGTTLTAKYLKLVETKYIAEDGREKTVMAGRIENGDIAFCSGWYVLDSSYTVNKPNTNNRQLKIVGDVNLILADNAEFMVKHDAWNDFTVNNQTNDTVLNIFGQKKQTGTIDFNGSEASFHYLNQYGGVLRSYDNAFKGKLKITGLYTKVRGAAYFGEANIKQFDYRGGKTNFEKLTVTEKATLSWDDTTEDFISGKLVNSSNAVFTIADDLCFKDQITDMVFKGQLSSNDISRLHSTLFRLLPYFEHNLGKPEWIWSEDCRDVKAVFHCTDDGCTYSYKARAKVSSEDYPSYTLYNAECTLFKNKYKSSQTVYKTWAPKAEITGSGTVTFDKDKAKAGEKVGFTVKPDSGYVLKSLKVVDKDGDKIPFNQNNQFEMFIGGATVYAVFIPTGNNPQREPYVDKDGAYILGNVAYYSDSSGVCYGLNSDGSVNMNEKLDDVSLSYFEFTLLDDGTYAITKCTQDFHASKGGELIIPKTYQGRKITVIGGSGCLFDDTYNKTCPVTLVLNQNITEIKSGTFVRPNGWIEKVTGDTSSLRTIGDLAFRGKGGSVDITLNYNGTVKLGSRVFYRISNVAVHLSHEATLSTTDLGATNVTYDYSDAHTYGEPVWDWDLDDFSGANVTRTCTHPNCGHTESVLADFVETTDEDGVPFIEAVAIFDDAEYHDVKPVYITEVGGYIVEVTGRFKGGVDPGKHNMVGSDGFRVVFKDKDGNKVNAPQYIWVAQESASDGIVVDPNGDVSFTKEGDFHVQITSPDGKTVYSSWIPVRSFWGGNDEHEDSDKPADDTSSQVIGPKDDMPKTGDAAPTAAALILLTGLSAALFLAMKRRKGADEV